ncbi:MAG: ABC transporter substrate-binding protein [Pseudobdellovibrionaceae bacterium]
MSKGLEKIKIASGGSWISLHPGLQHTVYADLVLSNQFDSLVGISEQGQLMPLGAKSWKISSDYKTFEFEIDHSRLFSDGSALTSYDYKRSWEDALSLSPKSNNNSLLDVLYKVIGFEDFEKTKMLSGIETPSKSTLIIRFKTPFRMAIDHLQGNRFSAYKEIAKDKFIGTGCYIIAEKSADLLELTPNPYNSKCKNLQTIELSVVKPDVAISELRSGKLDVFAYGFTSYLNSNSDEKNIRTVSGFEASHEVLFLNGIKGHFFENPKYRLAMQYLLQKSFDSTFLSFKDPVLFERDTQVYLPFQQGRLNEGEPEAIISEGEKYVEEMIAASKKHPLVVYTIYNREWVLDLVKKTGVSISDKSKAVTQREFLNVVYKTNEADLMPIPFSLAGNDPDNIYHALGRSGAIASKMVHREEVADLLESGREITDLTKLDEHYKEVSRSVLRQVPFVHLGFSKSFAMFREDKIRLKTDFVRRNFGHLDIYETK